MREMRRKDRAITTEEAYKIIDESPYGILCTVDQEMTPYGIPISHVRDENTIYFHCALDGQKTDNIKNHSTVCFTFVSQATPLAEVFSMAYASAVVIGHAEMLEEEEEKTKALYLICDKYAPHSKEEMDAYIKPKLHYTGICKVTITSITGKANQKKGDA